MSAGANDNDAAGDVDSVAVVEDDASTAMSEDEVRLRAALEAMLFAADEPLPMQTFLDALPEIPPAKVRRTIGQMLLEWTGDARGIHLHEVAGGFQFRTNPTYHDAVGKLFEARPTKLSRAAMETLAIVAYRQPVTKAVVDEIRGVDCGAVLRSLTDFDLVAVIGKADDIGRPNLYGTTRRFLEFFGLSSLTDLPTLADFEMDALELLGEDVEHLLGESEDPDG